MAAEPPEGDPRDTGSLAFSLSVLDGLAYMVRKTDSYKGYVRSYAETNRKAQTNEAGEEIVEDGEVFAEDVMAVLERCAIALRAAHSGVPGWGLLRAAEEANRDAARAEIRLRQERDWYRSQLTTIVATLTRVVTDLAALTKLTTSALEKQWEGEE